MVCEIINTKFGEDFDHSVCMTALCYSDLISAVLTNDQLLGKKKTCAKFQSAVLKPEGLEGQMNMA